MALMIPDSLPAKASQGEKRLFKTLHYRLPDDCYVWYEPILKGTFPDFVVLGPTLGLLILEVKGWYGNQIQSASHDFFEIKSEDATRPTREQSPIRQVKGYLDTLMNRFKGYPILTQPDGNYQGKIAFPVGWGVIMSNMTEVQSREENLYSLLEQPQVAYREELLAWEDLEERELMRRLESMFTTRFKFMALTEDQISTVRGILHPERNRIREKPATPQSLPSGVPLQPDSSVIVTLDLEQERLAADLREGHRLFYGVAGSGKTLILLARAKTLARRPDPQRILILCFNITLAAYLRSLVHDPKADPRYRERIEVRHFNDWAKSILGRLPNPRLVPEGEYNEVMGARLLERIRTLPDEEKWNAILVDEAHTFSPSWFRCCVSALKDPENGDLMIVSDGSQSLYKRQKFTWKSVDVKAQGRTKRLKQNYRNTQQILAAAWSIVHPFQSEEETDPEEDHSFPIVEPSAALRQGLLPRLYAVRSRSEEVACLCQEIQALHQSGYAPHDIAIIYRFRREADQWLFDRLIQFLKESELGIYWVTETDETKKTYSNRSPGVRLITALSALGLEFKAVLILSVQQFDQSYSDDREQKLLARRQLYVAMTRAQECLHLIGSGQGALLQELRQSPLVQVASALTE